MTCVARDLTLGSTFVTNFGSLDRPLLLGASLGTVGFRTALGGALLGAAELERLFELGGVEPDGSRNSA